MNASSSMHRQKRDMQHEDAGHTSNPIAGSDSYHDLHPEMSVQLDVLRLKAEHAAQAREEYEESIRE